MLSIPALNYESMLKVMLQSQHSIKQAQQKVGVKHSGVIP